MATLPSSASIDLVSSGIPIALHQGFASLSISSPASRGSTPAGPTAPPAYNHHHNQALHQHHSIIPQQQSHHLLYHSQHYQQAPHDNRPFPNQIPSKRRAGVCKFFNSLKGFGFVVDAHPEELGGQEVFCHFSAISGKGGFRSLAEGEEVEYDLVTGPKGFQASNLTGPGGRSVVGDPKARLTKPQTFMPFAPVGSSYATEPYQLQSPGVYATSPYTQHVLYVPASVHNPTVSVPTSQYPFASAPSQGSASTLASSSSSGNGTLSSFGSSGQYPSSTYSASTSSFPQAMPSSSFQPSHHAQRSTSSGVSTSSFGVPLSGGLNGHSNGHVNGNGVYAKENGSNIGSGNGLAFAPFNSPPSFSNAALFSPPMYPPSPPPAVGASSSLGGIYGLTQHQSQQQPARTSSGSSGSFVGSTGGGGGSASGHGAFGGSSGSSSVLFNGSNPTPTGVVGGGPSRSNTGGGGGRDSQSPPPAPVRSAREERRDERRGTPLGNGTLSGPGSVFAAPPVLYASGETTF